MSQAQRVAPHILIVDDQPANLDALEAMLGPTGCQVVRAGSPDEALLMLLRYDFAVIVLDIRMPGMSGLELAQLIKQRRRTRHVPIIFLTAHLVDENEILRGYGVGAVDYLSKPVNADILCSKVAVFVDAFRKTIALAGLNDVLQREITERTEAQRALEQANEELERRVAERTAALMAAHDVVRANEHRLRLALDTSRMGLWTVDAFSRSCIVDDRVLELFGIDRTDWDGRVDRLFSRIAMPERRELEARGVAPITSSAPFVIECRVEVPGGDVRWLAITGQGTPTPEGGTLVGLVSDVTAQRQASEDLREADRRKDEFLAVLAHELRNPLAPIRSAAGILGERAADDTLLQRVHAILDRQSAYMARLLDDLLDVSRLSAGKLTLKRSLVSVREIVEGAVETALPAIEQQRHKLKVTGLEHDMLVDGDTTRLTQIVGNLLLNAAKYTEPAGHITVAVARRGDDVEMCVRDTGRGIAPGLLPQVFDLFSQGASATGSHQGGGLGIGLALARRLTEMHGGTIEARSDGPGMGSEFVIRLPVARVAATSMVVDTFVATTQTTNGKSRVLVVDDNADAADAAAMLLEHEGYEVRVVYDGANALRAAAEFRPDITLLDLGMPMMDGYEVCRRLRGQPWATRARIVAVTGWGQGDDRRRTAEGGFDQHLVKPVDPREMLRVVREAMPMVVTERRDSGLVVERLET